MAKDQEKYDAAVIANYKERLMQKIQDVANEKSRILHSRGIQNQIILFDVKEVLHIIENEQ